MLFAISSIIVLGLVAWLITRCGYPEKAPMKPCK